MFVSTQGRRNARNSFIFIYFMFVTTAFGSEVVVDRVVRMVIIRAVGLEWRGMVGRVGL